MEQRTSSRLAIAGLVLLLPASVIVIPGLAQSLLGFRRINDVLDAVFADPVFSFTKAIIHPGIVLGGVTFALGLNAIAVFRFRFDAQETSIVSTILLKGRLLNMLVIVGRCLLLATMFIYAVVENIPC
jgi:hypothetical protein